jgi:type I restriction enzyme S subunit
VSKLAGYEFTKHITYEESGKIIALRGLNIKNNNLDLTDVKYIDNSELSKLERSKLFVDDLMFTYIGTIGEVALIKENDKFYLAPNVSRIRVDKNNILPIYILQFFNQDKFRNDEIAKYISSSSQPALSMESVRKFQIKFPSLPEQTKIASFLTAVDEKLQALKQKKTLLEQYKKGVMQKIFSQELRFKPAPSEISGDDTSTTLSAGNGNEYPDWEVKKLGEVLIKNSKKNKNQEFKLVQSVSNKRGFVNQDEYFEDRIIASKDLSNYYVIQKGDFAYNPSRIDVGSLAYKFDNNTSVISPLYISFKAVGDSLVDSFLLEWFTTQQFTRQMNNSFEGSVRNTLSYESLRKIEITFPCLEEQTKIANFLSSIDDKINHCGVQIEKMEVWKKGLLQQMFC